MRKFLDTVRADLTAQLVTAGETTAPQLNDLLIDLIDSSIEDEGGIFSLTPTNGLAVDLAYTEITSAFTANIGGDGVFIQPDFTIGAVQTSPTAGFSYQILVQLSVEIAKNDRFDFTVMQDGVPIGVGASVTGNGVGTNRPVGVSVTSLVLSSPANAVYTVAVKSPDGASTMNVLKASLFTVIKPTNNP